MELEKPVLFSTVTYIVGAVLLRDGVGVSSVTASNTQHLLTDSSLILHCFVEASTPTNTQSQCSSSPESAGHLNPLSSNFTTPSNPTSTNIGRTTTPTSSDHIAPSAHETPNANQLAALALQVLLIQEAKASCRGSW